MAAYNKTAPDAVLILRPIVVAAVLTLLTFQEPLAANRQIAAPDCPCFDRQAIDRLFATLYGDAVAESARCFDEPEGRGTRLERTHNLPKSQVLFATRPRDASGYDQPVCVAFTPKKPPPKDKILPDKTLREIDIKMLNAVEMQACRLAILQSESWTVFGCPRTPQ